MTYNQSAEICTLASHIERFAQERKFLRGVTDSTLAWYRHSFKAFGKVLEQQHPSVPAFKQAVIARIAELQTSGRGNKNVSINTYLRCLKAFLNWALAEGILAQPIKLSWLKEEQKILATFSTEQVAAILRIQPKSWSGCRMHTLVCLLFDTGLRISEALALTTKDVDLETMVIRVVGKGGKHRDVPMSFELRKRLWRFLQLNERKKRNFFGSNNGLLVFGTLHNTRLSKRDFERDFKALGKRLRFEGVRVSPHTCRHTFAVNYLRGGGNLEYLRRILGHSSIETTQKYLRSLGVEDLLAVHNRLSVLAQGRS